MELLLLTDIPGIGKKDDLVVVGDGYALNHLLPNRSALVATPSVRRRYAEQIKRRAMQREEEKQTQNTLLAEAQGKEVLLARKVTKTGKLYAAITAQHIADALKDQHGIDIAVESVSLNGPIKTAGDHQVSLSAAGETTSFTVRVTEEK